MYMKGKTIVHIGDHDLKSDNRVRFQMSCIDLSNNSYAYCRECYNQNSMMDKYYFSFLLFLILTSLKGIFKIKKLYGINSKHRLKLKFLNYNTLLTYKYFFKNTTQILNLIVGRRPDLIIANDLSCGLIAAYCYKKFNIPYYYDSHEFQIYRNYKNSLVKCLLVAGLEDTVVKNASKYSTVSEKIRRYYKYLYNKKGEIVVNNFYPSRDFTRVNTYHSEKKYNIAYFGYIGSGRGLKYLKYFQQADFIDKIFIYSDLNYNTSLRSEVSLLSKTIFNPYPQQLNSIQIENALGFCMIEPMVLSYKFALPGKFFQYLLCGFPIIALEGTYLAEIVSKFKVGIVITKKEIRKGCTNYIDQIEKIMESLPLAAQYCLKYFSNYNYDQFFSRLERDI